ncbi:MAG: hypothetical protein NVSMB4_15430 [Acidimicrobiales bacterium]
MTDALEPVKESQIEAAEAAPSDHFHDGITAEDGSLEAHVRDVHQVEMDAQVSASTLNGVHDRIHAEAHAVDE